MNDNLKQSLQVMRRDALRVIHYALTASNPPEMVRLLGAMYVIDKCLQWDDYISQDEELGVDE